MSLNIKNPEAHRLAQELAARTGESMATAVTRAVQERLERLSVRPLTERLLAIGKSCAEHLREPYRSLDHADLLYDERGLPQ
uniref:Transcription factor n=1 Tax=mine drainage metagenome TaxID=410659 RepID=E6Q6S5_9ZZZZ